MSDLVTVDLQDHILRLQLNRPDKKNALTQEMYGALADAIVAAEEDLTVRVILLTGTEGCFTAGNDLVDFRRPQPADEESPVHRFLLGLMRSSVPILAAVDGVAIGVGTTMLLHCDSVIATPKTRFQLPFVNLGLVPEAGSSYLLPKMLGHARASELISTGRPFFGDEALQLGIVSRLSEPETLTETAQAVAVAIARQPPRALRASKRLLKADRDQVEAAFRAELVAFNESLRSPEFAEAVAAFQEKREPRFD